MVGELEVTVKMSKGVHRQGDKINLDLTIKNDSEKDVQGFQTLVTQLSELCLGGVMKYKRIVYSSACNFEGFPLNPVGVNFENE